MTDNGTRDLLTATRLRSELQFQPELDAAFLELETPRQRVVDASRKTTLLRCHLDQRRGGPEK